MATLARWEGKTFEEIDMMENPSDMHQPDAYTWAWDKPGAVMQSMLENDPSLREQVPTVRMIDEQNMRKVK